MTAEAKKENIFNKVLKSYVFKPSRNGKKKVKKLVGSPSTVALKILIPSLSLSHLHYDHNLGSALAASQKQKDIRTVLLSTFELILAHIDSFSTLLLTHCNPLFDTDTGKMNFAYYGNSNVLFRSTEEMQFHSSRK